jgi:heptosyltransferase I
MQVSARANLAGACVNAGIKLGWDKGRSRDFHQLFMTHSIPQISQQHQVQGHLEFARTLGLDADEPVWDFPVTDDATRYAQETLPGEQQTLLISPCSSHTHRNWITDRYATVADYAVENHGMRVLITGGPSQLESQMGEQVERAMHQPVNNLVGQVSLDQLMALLQRASVVLSPDSGPAHMANALGTPVIGLHACTWSIRGGPYNYLDLCVDKFPLAARKFRDSKPEDIRWGKKIEQTGVMELIQTDEVIGRLSAAVERL